MALRSLLKRARAIARGLSAPEHYREMPVTHPVRIDRLISPLRYDVLVRKQQLLFLKEHRRLFDDDFPAYLQMAKRSPYFIWFRDIAMRRSDAQRAMAGTDLDTAFANRLRRNAALFDSYFGRGFDPSSPVTLRAGKTIVAADSGKALARPLYTGGGCHRIALMLLEGRTELPPQWVRVRVFKTYQPLDHTAKLIAMLSLDAESYYRFLSLGYTDRMYETREDLRADVAATSPERLAELDDVLSFDEPILRTVDQAPAAAV